MVGHPAGIEGTNPLLTLHSRCYGHAAARDDAIRHYAFAVPDDRALDAVVSWASAEIIEIGAGTGYWAHLLHQRGADVDAFDVAPAPSPHNPWFAGVEPWHPLQRGDETAIDAGAARCLLLVWPTRDETWPARAVQRFHAHGGDRVAFVGDPPGGRTGDDELHALLGLLDRCYRCAYGLVDGVCTCDVVPIFEPAHRVSLPTWEGFDDELILFRRRSAGPQGRPRRWRRAFS